MEKYKKNKKFKETLKSNYVYNSKFLKELDKLIEKYWPKEAKKLKELTNELGTTVNEDPRWDIYYELKDLLKDNLVGSISRYFTPFIKER